MTGVSDAPEDLNFQMMSHMMHSAENNSPLDPEVTSSSKLDPQAQISSNLSQSERSRGQSSSSHQSSGNPSHGTDELPQSSDLTVKYAKYADEQARQETYGGWPRNHPQTPANLAKAGFFATGNGDEVKCFYCGGELEDWSIGDDPWEEHVRWSTRCEWLLQQKGLAFVDSVNRKYGPGNHSYFEPNMIVPGDQLSTALPALPLESQPMSEGVASAAAAASLAEQEKEKSEKIEELLKSELVKNVVDAGEEEDIIKTVLSGCLESGQSPPKTTEELLRAIHDAEEFPRGAIGCGPAESLPILPESIPENTGPDVKTNEARRLKVWLQKKLCKVCSQPRKVVFLPCQHMVTCKKCSELLIRCIEERCGRKIEEKIECILCEIMGNLS